MTDRQRFLSGREPYWIQYPIRHKPQKEATGGPVLSNFYWDNGQAQALIFGPFYQEKGQERKGKNTITCLVSPIYQINCLLLNRTENFLS